MVLGVYICLVQKIEICTFPQVGSADLSIEVREVRHSSLDRGFFALLTFVVACLYLLCSNLKFVASLKNNLQITVLMNCVYI